MRAGCFSLHFFNTLISILPFSSGMAGSYRETGERIFTGPFLLQVITVCLAAPAGEEWAFRAVLFGHLRREMGFAASAVLSSLMFGIYTELSSRGCTASFWDFCSAWSEKYTEL
ncbi:CPBP family intramembrane metalloprotease [Clostridium sp. AM58-1XD]|nr:CPBP family intramembrane metalloprotease [Clostridium sp. AM58-1XD]